jgi:hypothetical protein
MSSSSHDLILFLGRFHPMLVHLPIGGLVLVGALELLGKFSHFRCAAQNNRLLLGLVAAISIVTAGFGWMLSQAGGYDAQLLPLHKWLGFSFAAACTLTWLLSWRGPPRAYGISLLATFGILAVAGHLGGSLTHGRDYLTQFAPGPLRALMGAKARPAAAPKAATDSTQQPVFSTLIHPILERRCSACHGPEKHKGGLSMESYDALLKGGEHGLVIIAGKALDSPMIHRVLLPLNDDDHMPPDGKPQPTLAEIAVLQWWIERGAPADKTIGELQPAPEIQRIITAAQAGTD